MAVLLDSRGGRRDSDIGFQNRRWLALRRWCAGSFQQVRLFDLPIARHEEDRKRSSICTDCKRWYCEWRN